MTVVLEDRMAIHEPAAATPTSGAPAAGSTWDRASDSCRRWLDGDDAALDQLVRLMTPVLWHVARACSLSEQEAEDVVQTTWATFVRSGDRLRDPQAVGRWLTTTARREAWRVSRAGARATLAEDDVLDRVAPPHRSAESEAVALDEDTRLWGAVRALDERCQMLLRVVAFSDRPDYAGIASDLGMPVGSIGPTRMRCLRKLRVLLEERSTP
jgi:RNA polymerase sigma factor (sigma-70 family)